MSNLKPPTPEEAKRRGRNGGIKSGQRRKEKKMMRDFAEDILEMPLRKGSVDRIKTLSDVRGANITIQQAILLAATKKALNGDIRAAEYVRDTAGQKPVAKNDMTVQTDNGMLQDILDQLKE